MLFSVALVLLSHCHLFQHVREKKKGLDDLFARGEALYADVRHVRKRSRNESAKPNWHNSRSSFKPLLSVRCSFHPMKRKVGSKEVLRGGLRSRHHSEKRSQWRTAQFSMRLGEEFAEKLDKAKKHMRLNRSTLHDCEFVDCCPALQQFRDYFRSQFTQQLAQKQNVEMQQTMMFEASPDAGLGNLSAKSAGTWRCEDKRLQTREEVTAETVCTVPTGSGNEGGGVGDIKFEEPIEVVNSSSLSQTQAAWNKLSSQGSTIAADDANDTKESKTGRSASGCVVVAAANHLTAVVSGEGGKVHRRKWGWICRRVGYVSRRTARSCGALLAHHGLEGMQSCFLSRVADTRCWCHSNLENGAMKVTHTTRRLLEFDAPRQVLVEGMWITRGRTTGKRSWTWQVPWQRGGRRTQLSLERFRRRIWEESEEHRANNDPDKAVEAVTAEVGLDLQGEKMYEGQENTNKRGGEHKKILSW